MGRQASGMSGPVVKPSFAKGIEQNRVGQGNEHPGAIATEGTNEHAM